MGSASLRPLRDLSIDRGNLHAIFGSDEKRFGLGRSRHRRLVQRHRRHGAEARTSGTVRSPRHHSLPAAGLERYHCLRLLASAIPSSSLWLLAIGGILYSLGALFHVWQRLRFHNAIWHGFVLLAASCHYSAVLACLPWA